MKGSLLEYIMGVLLAGIIIFGGISAVWWLISKTQPFTHRICQEWRTVTKVEPIEVSGFFGGDIHFIIYYDNGSIDDSSFAGRAIGEQDCVKYTPSSTNQNEG